FGIINPKFLKSDSCWFDSGITCKEAAIQGDFIVLVLVNGFRQDITPKQLELVGKTKTTECDSKDYCLADKCGLNPNTPWIAGSKRTIRMKCPIGSYNNIDVYMNITYIASDFGKYTKIVTGKAELTKR
ncbi:MAG: hypothetical protein ABIJ21_08225, partial [Nanoarchaeota archaeon]